MIAALLALPAAAAPALIWTATLTGWHYYSHGAAGAAQHFEMAPRARSAERATTNLQRPPVESVGGAAAFTLTLTGVALSIPLPPLTWAEIRAPRAGATGTVQYDAGALPGWDAVPLRTCDAAFVVVRGAARAFNLRMTTTVAGQAVRVVWGP